MPRWGEESAEWSGFVADIKANGIRHPLQITSEGIVVDGETRRRAAIELGLTEVPVLIVADDEVATIILRELSLRRHLTKGQLAFLAVPLLEQAFEEAVARGHSNLKMGENANVSPESIQSTPGTLEEIAAAMGISYDTLNQARKLRIEVDQLPEDEREALLGSLFDPTKPSGLGALLAGLGFLAANKARGGHSGNRPTDPQKRFRLFFGLLKVEGNRFRYYEEADDTMRQEYWRNVRTHVFTLPANEAASRAEFHGRMAKELRAAAQREVVEG